MLQPEFSITREMADSYEENVATSLAHFVL